MIVRVTADDMYTCFIAIHISVDTVQDCVQLKKA